MSAVRLVLIVVDDKNVDEALVQLADTLGCKVWVTGRQARNDHEVQVTLTELNSIKAVDKMRSLGLVGVFEESSSQIASLVRWWNELDAKLFSSVSAGSEM